MERQRGVSERAPSAALVLLFFLFRPPVLAQDRPQGDSNPSAQELARQVTANELKAQEQDRSRWSFRLEWPNSNGQLEADQVIQTTDGDLKRPLLIDGRALTDREKQKSDKQIQQLVRDPGPLRKARAQQAADAARSLRLLAMLPRACRFTYGERRGDLVQLNFSPQPNFHPPSHEAEVFHAMQGSLWVDASQSRVEEISGRLIHDVKFGGGILGRVNQGGTFEVKQAEVAAGHWELTLLKIQMQGKALFFKTIGVRENYTRSQFHPVPENLSVAEAARMIAAESRATPAPAQKTGSMN